MLSNATYFAFVNIIKSCHFVYDKFTHKHQVRWYWGETSTPFNCEHHMTAWRRSNNDRRPVRESGSGLINIHEPQQPISYQYLTGTGLPRELARPAESHRLFKSWKWLILVQFLKSCFKLFTDVAEIMYSSKLFQMFMIRSVKKCCLRSVRTRDLCSFSECPLVRYHTDEFRRMFRTLWQTIHRQFWKLRPDLIWLFCTPVTLRVLQTSIIYYTLISN